MEAWQTWEHIIIRCGVAVVLLSVWTWRFKLSTRFRCRSAQNMTEEFKCYGLSKRTMYAVGAFKIVISLCFLFGHWAPFLIRPSAILLAPMMLYAVYLHLNKEEDGYLKALPAYLVLFFSTYLVIM